MTSTNAYFPTQLEIDTLLTKVEGIIGLSASCPQETRFKLQPPREKAENYKQLWQEIEDALCRLNAAGFPFRHANPHKDLGSIWAWCWVNGDSAKGRMSKPHDLYQEIKKDLRSLRDSLKSGCDTPGEILRELQESRKRSNELFVIMSFNPETDCLWKDVIIPVAKELDLKPIRIDKEEPESSISEEILSSIRRSLLVLCDLSFERPNCYFEAGFAKGSFRRVIFTARFDHNPRSEERGKFKVHFDLDQCKISWWNPSKLQEAKTEFKSRIETVLSAIRMGNANS